jgi:hypothetical protein
MQTCVLCGTELDPVSEGFYRSLDRMWECRDYVACLARRRAVLASLERGLAAAWRVLDTYLETR